ncbi:hypothetical protein [Jiangella alba]|uniref:WXG100 family type VII secretion target n=1 Tax=Jiangella alba TaxID=561176 RepID=A0A1H5P9T5_9ACTN|nr:hypothetical protein [Jiangella alba]SEF10672.1 hypothetical protein SAMN04488561_3969 [Jiangella alba]
MADQVSNPYRAALCASRDDARPVSDDLKSDLDAAVRAMDNGAWQSSIADTFYTELTGHKTTLTTAAEGVMTEFGDAIEHEEPMVDANAWQVRWRNV